MGHAGGIRRIEFFTLAGNANYRSQLGAYGMKCFFIEFDVLSFYDYSSSM